eukprot:5461241-Alexandrium_andersonii.AAC.1
MWGERARQVGASFGVSALARVGGRPPDPLSVVAAAGKGFRFGPLGRSFFVDGISGLIFAGGPAKRRAAAGVVRRWSFLGCAVATRQ